MKRVCLYVLFEEPCNFVTGKYIFNLKMLKYLPTHTTGQKIRVQSDKMTQNDKEKIKSLYLGTMFSIS